MLQNMAVSKKEFLLTFLLVITYAAAFYGLQLFLYRSGMIFVLPDDLNLLFWDAGWYHTISVKGYVYDPTGVNSLAFFPLFPLVWYIAHVGVWGMCALNAVFFALGFSILNSMFRLSTQNKILWLSVPAVYFAFIPYTEALFFLLGSVSLYGIRNNNKPVIIASLFLLSLTRPTGVILTPPLLAMALFANDNKQWYRSLWTFFTVYFLPMAAGTALFIWYEYLKSGVWFVFFDIEKKYWGHELNFPKLPFASYAGPPLIWISAIAVFLGFFCFCYLLVRFIKWILKNSTFDPLLIVSCGYLLMSMLVVVLFNPAWGMNVTTTNVSGIYRYTLMNPFFYVFLYHFTHMVTYTWKDYLIIFFMANIVWLSFGSYGHIQTFLYFNANTVLLFLYMLHADKKITWPVMILTAINIFFQVHFFQLFIANVFPE